MSLLESFKLDKERRRQESKEKQQMEFAREQNDQAIGYTEDNSYSVHQTEKSDLLKWQQDFEKEIMEIKYKLLGYTLANGVWMKDPTKKPICNNAFIEYEFDPIISAFLSRNAFNTNLTKGEISKLLTNTFLDLGRNLRFKHKEYSIEFRNFDVITRSLKNLAKMGINKAEGGWLKRIDSTMSKRLESIHERQQEQQQKGLFNFGG